MLANQAVIKTASSGRASRLQLALCALAYIALLLYSYAYIIDPAYSYRGLRFNPPSVYILAVAIVFALLPILWIPLNTQRASIIVHYVLYLLLYVPVCIVPACSLDISQIQLLGYLVVIATCFGIVNYPLYCLTSIRPSRS